MLYLMRNNEEVERLRKEKARHNKEDSLSKEEEAASWAKTVEVLEKAYKDFGSKKDVHILVWECEEDYKDEDKVACKKEVIRILKMCKREDILINKPAIANLIYVNRLNKREDNKRKIGHKWNGSSCQ